MTTKPSSSNYIQSTPDSLDKFRRIIQNLESFVHIIQDRPEKNRLPLIRTELGKNMVDLDSVYVKLVKELDDLQ